MLFSLMKSNVLTFKSELPSNLVLKKISPKIWLPLLTSIWGIFTICFGFVQGYGSFVAVRALLGVAEGGLLPGMVLYLSQFYRRTELAVRIGIFYTAASLSGAFGGLLARGLSAIGHRGGLEGWRWIFVIEGLITVLCGVISYLLLPNGIHSAGFLSQEEKDFAQNRLEEEAIRNGTRYAYSPCCKQRLIFAAPLSRSRFVGQKSAGASSTFKFGYPRPATSPFWPAFIPSDCFFLPSSTILSSLMIPTPRSYGLSFHMQLRLCLQSSLQ
jgi:MFS family permease